jgi:hypothetical protein
MLKFVNGSAVPVFLSVTVCPVLGVPTDVTEKLNRGIEIPIPGGIADADIATTPTVEEDVSELSTALSAAARGRDTAFVTEMLVPEEIVTVPVIAPVLAGVTVIFNLHDAPLLSEDPQLSVSVNSPLGVIARLVSAWPVSLVNVAICELDCMPTVCTPKLITGGVRVNP